MVYEITSMIHKRSLGTQTPHSGVLPVRDLQEVATVVEFAWNGQLVLSVSCLVPAKTTEVALHAKTRKREDKPEDKESVRNVVQKYLICFVIF